MKKVLDKKGQEWKANEVAKIKSGKFAGIVGYVTDTAPDTGMVRLKVDGVLKDQPIKMHEWLKAGNLERQKK